MATLYPPTINPKLIPQKSAKFDARSERAKALYGPGVRVVHNYSRPRVQAVAHDKEARERELAHERELLALARSGLVPEETLERGLKRQRQYDAKPVGQLARGKRWGGTWETLRLAAGGDSVAAKAVYDDAVRGLNAVAKIAPTFARRVVETGADTDVENVRDLAALGAKLREAAETPKK